MATKMFEELTTERQPSPEPEVRFLEKLEIQFFNHRLSLRWRRSWRAKLNPYPGLGKEQPEAEVGEMIKLQEGIQGGRVKRKGGGRGGIGGGRRRHSRLWLTGR